MTKRVYLVAPVCTPALEARLGRPGFSGAAARKTVALVGAMRSVGVRAYLVTIPHVARAAPGRVVRASAYRESGALVVSTWNIGLRVLSRIVGSISLLGFFVHRRLTSNDHVIFYNFVPEYLLGLCFLRACGVECLYDVEDVPEGQAWSLRLISERVMFKVMRTLCSNRVLVASEAIAKRIGATNYIVVHGTVALDSLPRRTPGRNQEAVVLFGGLHMDGTGAELFAAAVQLLAAQPAPSTQARLRVVVTGFGREKLFEALADQCDGTWVSVEVKLGIAANHYKALLDCVDIGLSLKLPDSVVGGTTFPSKVLEYAERGIAIVSTRVPDVEALLPDGCAYFIDRAEPNALASCIASLVLDSEGRQLTGLRGRAALIEAAQPRSVGRRLREFLFRN